MLREADLESRPPVHLLPVPEPHLKLVWIGVDLVPDSAENREAVDETARVLIDVELQTNTLLEYRRVGRIEQKPAAR